MIWLIAIVLSILLLYLWLIDWWFARVLMFIVLIVPVSLLIGVSSFSATSTGPADIFVPGFLIGIPVAAGIAWIPYWIRKAIAPPEA
jgi:hypothetical protein